MKSFACIFLVSCLSYYQALAQPANDNFAAATPVSGLINGCSANAAFTTVSATADQAAGSCAANGPNYNVWFKFVATATTFMDVKAITGGAAGTNQYTFLTLWDASLVQLSCSPYVGQQFGTNEVNYLGLVNGATYYISVDNYAGAGYQGTFQLCLSDVVSNDYQQGALSLNGILNGCSANAAYTTVGAFPDHAKGSCAANGPNNNVWFKFTATATTFMDVKVITGGAAGDNQYTFLTLWDGSLTELSCSPYVGQQFGTNEVSFFGLVPAATYYISVDNYAGAGYRGSFQICLSDAVTNDYQQGATNLNGIINGCSTNAAYTTIGGSPDHAKGSCAANGPNYNVWFKFTATATTFMDVKVNTGGAAGDDQYTFLTLWDAGLTELSCSPYVGQQFGTYEVSKFGLTPGAIYYVSVDNYAGAGYRGSFQICLSDVVTNDYQQGATNLNGIINGCSANAAYTTVGGSPDQVKGSCAANGPNYNVWFKFTATATTFMDVKVNTGGAAGDNQYTFLTLWDAGLTELSCSPYVGQQFGTNEVSKFGLTAGAIYYISVDNYAGAGYRGSFQICLSDVVTNDYKQGATNLNGIINGCSANAAYTTVGGSPDQAKGSCAANGPNYNVWFKFTATATTFMDVKVITGGAAGDNQYTFLTLWDAALTELSCSPYVGQQFGTNEVSKFGLTPGLIYYISVDNYAGAGYRGSFQICLSDVVTNDYKQGATSLNGIINGCSANAAYTTVGGSPDQAAGSCAANGPNYNVWFKFTATATTFMDVKVITGGAAGDNQYTFLTLWDASLTEISCSPYVGQQFGTNEVSKFGLIPGATYYISVDNYVGAGYRGSFKLCLSDVVTYDYNQGALDVTNLINTCSANAAFTTIGATADKAKGSCAANGPNYNVWFRFIATASTFIDVQVITGGAAGDNQYTFLTLWSSALAELACSPYVGQQFGTNETSFFGLTPGNTYYISVDNYVGAGYRGSFKLCLSDVPDYNFYQGANNLTNLNNWCSADAAYTTVAATADKNPGSCWNSAGGANRWFKFVAITNTATIQAKTGGSEGTLQYPYLAIWQANGTTEVACATYVSQFSDLSLTVATLVVGNTYYISVDNYTGAGYEGTFKLCITNVGPIYYSRQNGPWTDPNSWSNIGYHNATASVAFPGAGDIADIQGNDITVTANQSVAELNLDVSVANTSISVSTGLLTVNGQMTMNNPGNNFTGSILLQANGSLYVNDILSLSRAGGNQGFGITVNSGSAATINVDLNWASSAGTAVDNLLTVNGTGTVTVNRDVNLTSTGGRLIKLQFNNTSVFTAKRDITFTATAAALESVELNNTAQLKIARNFVRGVTPFGSLSSNGSSTVEYNGVIYLQNFAPSAGSGGDSFTYQNVKVNNTHGFVPQITMGGAATVNSNLTMTSGVVSSTAVNILNLLNASVTTIGSVSSFIDGPMTYEVASNVANTIRNFPIGKSGTYRPAILSVTHSDNASVIYTAEHFNSSAAALGYTLPPTVDRVSGIRYWQIDRTAVANFTSAIVTLYYGIGSSDGVNDPPNLTVVKNIGAGTTWFDIGGTGSAAPSGSITSLPFNSFSKFTLGDRNGGANPLPIVLVNFSGHFDGQSVILDWKTASELKNDYFMIQRSKDGAEFEDIRKVKGAGTKQSESFYQEYDDHPLEGLAYYRLRQVDLGGKSEYSHIIAIDSKLQDKYNVVLYPNPTDGNGININLKRFDQGEEIMISVMDLFGKRVFEKIIRIDSSGELLSSLLFRDKISAGMYVVVVTSKNGSSTTKIIVR